MASNDMQCLAVVSGVCDISKSNLPYSYVYNL